MASKVYVSIKYSNPETQPPIYLAGSFTEPQWQPQEMDYSTREDGEHEFHKEVEVEEGTDYQYKFRIGEGDWWILNENSPTVTDDIGNRNNVLSIPKSERVGSEREQDRESTDTTKGLDSESNAAQIAKETHPIKQNETRIVQTHHQHETAQMTPAIEPFDPINSVVYRAPTEENLEGKQLKDHSITHVEVEEIDPAAAEEFNMLMNKPTTKTVSTPAPTVDIDREAEALKLVKSQDAKEPSVPTLVIEKTDETPRHGDDFGPNATYAQREARQAHSLDAKPDHVTTRGLIPDIAATAAEVADSAADLDREAPTPPISDEEAGRIGYRRMSTTPIPEIAATAAEVADAASFLDREAPTPPISDEEAGRVGYRRMSTTPIPEVAATAAEVADTASFLDRETPNPPMTTEEAGRTGHRRMSNTPVSESAKTAAGVADVDVSLDSNFLPLILEPEPSYFPPPTDSGRNTPIEERVPRFSHECSRSSDHIEPCQHEPTGLLPEERSSYENSSEEIDLYDPNIEIFPTERNAFLAKLREIQERLPPDETVFDGVPMSPVVGTINRPSSNGRLHTPSPARGIDRSSSLHSIPEDVEKGDFLTLTDTSKSSGPQPSRTLEKFPETAKPGTSQAYTHNTVPESSRIPEHIGSENQVHRHPLAETRGRSQVPTIEAESSGAAGETVSTAFTPLRRELPLLSDGSADEPKAMPVPEHVRRIVVQETRPTSPPKSPKMIAQLDLAQRIPPTPFLVGNFQLSHNDTNGGVQVIPSGMGPTIAIVPATPEVSNMKGVEKSLSAYMKSKSTAIEDDKKPGDARERKPSSIQSPERAPTPSSVRSAGKDAKKRNFLKVFWKVVFVDWIGGIIMKLCGGDRKAQKTKKT